MKYEREEVVTVNGIDIYIVDVIEYEDNIYIYGVGIKDDSVTSEYYICKHDDLKNGLVQISDADTIKSLLRKFIININKDI